MINDWESPLLTIIETEIENKRKQADLALKLGTVDATLRETNTDIRRRCLAVKDLELITDNPKIQRRCAQVQESERQYRMRNMT